MVASASGIKVLPWRLRMNERVIISAHLIYIVFLVQRPWIISSLYTYPRSFFALINDIGRILNQSIAVILGSFGYSLRVF